MQKPQTNTSANDLYLGALRFAEEHNNISYREFDSFVLKELNMFDAPDEEFLLAAEKTVDQIITALPAFKRIFARPIVRLKDEQQIVPVEAVRSVGSHSLAHLSSHSTLWANISSDGITPKKLMTVEYAETYSIYENIAFAHAVNKILYFTRHTLTRMSDVLYGCRDVHFNLLDRSYHNMYFLALGKLHLGYVRAKVAQPSSKRIIEKLLFVEKTLRQKLSSPVYVACNQKKLQTKLKKTNIFRSHKDYAEVYRILNMFDSDTDSPDESIVDVRADSEEFRCFVNLLSLFAAGHFNFTFKDNSVFDFKNLTAHASFLEWSLLVRSAELDGVNTLLFTTKKEKEYTTCLFFCENDSMSSSKLKSLKEKIEADEYFFCSPNTFGQRDILYLSIFDIDAFSRIQQLILRGMIYADTSRTHCAFCGGTLEKKDSSYECEVCDAEIKECVCEKHALPFYTSGIKHFSHSSGGGAADEKRKFLHDRIHEAMLHFRNITPIAEDGSPLCPHCGKRH